MNFLHLHGFEKITNSPCLRNKRSFPDQSRQILKGFELRPGIPGEKFQSIFIMNNSYYIIYRLSKYRITGISFLKHGIHNGLKIVFLIKCDHILAMRHNVLGFSVRKLHDILDHLCFVFLNDTLLMGFIYNGNDLFLRHRILRLIKSNTKWPCCQLGNKGYAHSKRIQDPGKKSYNLHIPICIFFRVIGSDSPECKNTKRRKQNDHQCKHQDQCSQMLYVGMKGLGSPWNDKCSETDSGSHNNQRNRIDK